jgi:hypothetical protein
VASRFAVGLYTNQPSVAAELCELEEKSICSNGKHVHESLPDRASVIRIEGPVLRLEIMAGGWYENLRQCEVRSMRTNCLFGGDAMSFM